MKSEEENRVDGELKWEEENAKNIVVRKKGMEGERTKNAQCGMEVGLTRNNVVKGGMQDIMIQ